MFRRIDKYRLGFVLGGMLLLLAQALPNEAAGFCALPQWGQYACVTLTVTPSGPAR